MPSTHSQNAVWKIRKEEWAEMVREDTRGESNKPARLIAKQTQVQLLYCLVVFCCGANVLLPWFSTIHFSFILAASDLYPPTDPLFRLSHFSASRFQLLRRSSRLPCASSPSTYPATAEINLRPVSTAFNNMCPGRVQTLKLCVVCVLDLVPVCPEPFNPRASPNYFSQKRLKLYCHYHNHQNHHFNVWRRSSILVCIYPHTVVSPVIRRDSCRSLHSAKLTSNYEHISGLPLLFLRPACLLFLGSQYLMGFFFSAAAASCCQLARCGLNSGFFLLPDG